MRDAKKLAWALACGLAVCGMVASSCHQVPFTAPQGSLIELSANPTSVPAYGGVSIISALVIEPAGTLVPDGTVVQFFTNLGTIEPQGKTNDGVARVKFVSDSRSGTATITACSGSGGSTTPVPTPAPTPVPTGTPFRPAAAASATSGSGGGSGCDTYSLPVGSILVTRLVVTAYPSRILPRQLRQSEIVANVLDSEGDPVVNVPVFFVAEELNAAGTEVAGPAKFEWMGSNGNPVFTDNNGRAYDILYTRYGEGQGTRPVRVTATIVGSKGAAITDFTTVMIN